MKPKLNTKNVVLKDILSPKNLAKARAILKQRTLSDIERTNALTALFVKARVHRKGLMPRYLAYATQYHWQTL